MNKKKNTRVLILTIVILLLIIGFFEMLPGIRYKMAMKKLESGDYDSAYKTLKSLGKKDEIALNLYDRAEACLEAEEYEQAYELATLLNSDEYCYHYPDYDKRKRLETVATVYYNCSQKNFEMAYLILAGNKYYSYLLNEYSEHLWHVISEATSEYVQNEEYEKAYSFLYRTIDDKCRVKSLSLMEQIRPQYAESIKEMANAPVGSYIELGYYYSSMFSSYNVGTFNIFSDKQSKIEWQVLAKDGSKMLLVSRYVLVDKPYNLSDDPDGITTFGDWRACSLRSWLNGEFISKTFDPVEQRLLVSTAIPNEDPTDYEKPISLTCYDEVFLLSVEEARKYLSLPNGYMPACPRIEHNDYAEPDSANWWLRTLSREKFARSAYVNEDREIDSIGFMHTSDCGVRPAMWIDFDRLDVYLK